MKNRIFTVLLFILSFNLYSQTWSTIRLDNASSIGGAFDIYSSIKTVNGNPAMVYADVSHRDLVFRRANDPDGTSWGNPQIIDYDGFIGKFCKLEIVNGNPAICYYSEIGMQLRYVRATDANGTNWGTPVVLGTASTTDMKMAVVNGNPAVCYTSGFSIQFKRANDINGNTWGTAIGFNFPPTPILLDFTTVNGNPTICIGDGNNLRYLRASNSNGTSWPTSTILETSINIILSGTIQIINGNPAIAYTTYTAAYLSTLLKYIRSSDSNGDMWNAAQLIENDGYYSKLVIVSGKPAIIYGNALSFDNNAPLKIVKANDVDGSNAWNSPQSIPNTTNGIPNSVEIVNGNPAISITQNYSGAGLRYIRAGDSDGNSWNTPISIEGKGETGYLPSATMVNGNPAFSYLSQENGSKLKYYRANDPQGTTWGDPVIVTNLTGIEYLKLNYLKIVNGNPAIIFDDYPARGVKYVRANDNSGSSWNTPTTIVTDGLVQPDMLEVVNGNPAIAYSANSPINDLKFIRASNPDGSAWGIPQTLDVNGESYKSMKIVNANPAIAYKAKVGSFYKVRFIRAIDASGNSWSTPVEVFNDEGNQIRLNIVNGNPAMVFEYSADIYYSRANDVNGSSWSTPKKVSSGIYCSNPNLEVIAGKPVVSYFFTNYLGTNETKIVQGLDVNGTNWDIPKKIFNNGEYNSLFPLSSNQAGVILFNYNEYYPYFSSATLSTVLPLELLTFQAQNTEGPNKLTWQTATETNTSHFDIERSPDGKAFEKIGEVKAKGSNSEYQYLDKIGAFSTIYYRLKINDLDGKSDYSKVVNLTAKVKGFSAKVYPNPLKDQATIEITTEQKTDVSIELYDVIGRQVKRLKVENTEWVLTMPMSMNDLSSGTYFLKISSNTNSIQQKIVKQ
jgi:hypothetical protein